MKATIATPLSITFAAGLFENSALAASENGSGSNMHAYYDHELFCCSVVGPGPKRERE